MRVAGADNRETVMFVVGGPDRHGRLERWWLGYGVHLVGMDRYDRWVESAQRTDDGPIGTGSKWTHRRIQGRRRFDAPIELVEFASPRRFVMASGSRGFDVRSTMTFEQVEPDETKVSEVLEMRGRH